MARKQDELGVLVGLVSGLLACASLGAGCSSFKSHLKSELPQGPLRVQTLTSRELSQGVFEYVAPPQSIVAPVFVDGDKILLVTMGGNIELRDMQSFKTIWKYDVIPGVQAQPLVVGSSVFVAGMDSKVRRIRMDSGKLEWEAPIPAESPGGISSTRGMIFVTAADDSLSALDERTGAPVWNYKRPARAGNVLWSLMGNSVPALSPDGNTIYCGFSDGAFVALESASGKTVWERNFDRLARFKDVDTSPVISPDGSAIYLSLVDSDLVVLRARDGSTLSSFPGAAASAPYVDNKEKALYLSTRDAKVVKISLEDQRVLWTSKLDTRGMGSKPTPLWDGFLAVTTMRAGLVLLDRKTGDLLWEDSYSTGTLAPPAFDGRRLAVVSGRNWLHLYAVEKRQ